MKTVALSLYVTFYGTWVISDLFDRLLEYLTQKLEISINSLMLAEQVTLYLIYIDLALLLIVLCHGSRNGSADRAAVDESDCKRACAAAARSSRRVVRLHATLPRGECEVGQSSIRLKRN